MDELSNELVEVAVRLEHAAEAFDSESAKSRIQKLTTSADEISKAWSGSWIGCQANVYTARLQPRRPGEHFDSEFGFDRISGTVGDWTEYDMEDLIGLIFKKAGLPRDFLFAESKATEQVFNASKAEVVTTIQALLQGGEDKVLRDFLNMVNGQESHVDAGNIAAGIPRDDRRR